MSIEIQQLRQIDTGPTKKRLRCDIGEPMHISDETIAAYREVLAASGVSDEDIDRYCAKVTGIANANHVPNARVNRRGLASIVSQTSELIDGKPNPLPNREDIVVLKKG